MPHATAWPCPVFPSAHRVLARHGGTPGWPLLRARGAEAPFRDWVHTPRCPPSCLRNAHTLNTKASTVVHAWWRGWGRLSFPLPLCLSAFSLFSKLSDIAHDIVNKINGWGRGDSGKPEISRAELARSWKVGPQAHAHKEEPPPRQGGARGREAVVPAAGSEGQGGPFSALPTLPPPATKEHHGHGEQHGGSLQVWEPV